ncbi:MAG: hypothetical protein ACLUKN_14855 [Bacilli bacterium]
MKSNAIISQSELQSITTAHCAVPHDFLGMHKCKGGIVARAICQTPKLVLWWMRATVFIPHEMFDKSGF